MIARLGRFGEERACPRIIDGNISPVIIAISQIDRSPTVAGGVGPLKPAACSRIILRDGKPSVIQTAEERYSLGIAMLGGRADGGV